MRRTLNVISVAMAMQLLLAGCYGPFNLTRRLYRWNGQIAGKWEKEFMFLILAYVPVYGITVLADGIVFNSMEFWTGRNPVDPPGVAQRALPQTKRIVRGDSEAVLTYTPSAEGAQLAIQQFQHGHATGSLLVRQQDGSAVGTDANGNVLMTARMSPEGGVFINDGHGRQLASYTPEQAERMWNSRR